MKRPVLIHPTMRRLVFIQLCLKQSLCGLHKLTMMTLYFNRVLTYSQDSSLPYGPIYETKLQPD